MSMETKNDLAKKRFLFAAAFVLLSFIILLIVFLVNKDKIFTNLKETDFFEKIFGSTPAVIENHQVKHNPDEEMPMREEFVAQGTGDESAALPELKSSSAGITYKSNSNNILYNEDDFSNSNGISTDASGISGMNNINNGNNDVYAGEFGVPGTFDNQFSDVKSVNNNSLVNGNGAEDLINDENIVASLNENQSSNVVDSGFNFSNTKMSQDNQISNGVTGNIGGSSTENSKSIITKNVAPKTAVVANSTLDLCFVMIDGDGAVLRKMVKRAVPRSDSPLTTAINLLLEGPDVRNKEEINCRSLIPEGSRLLSARVSDGVAYLNFNEDFEFNPFGVEGAIHQLEQIVYTATAFSTVNSVQFLIEGDKQEYLGSEGQWIGTPLSRANF